MSFFDRIYQFRILCKLILNLGLICIHVPLVLKAGAPEWPCLLHYIGVTEQALGWLPLGLGLGFVMVTEDRPTEFSTIKLFPIYSKHLVDITISITAHMREKGKIAMYISVCTS